MTLDLSEIYDLSENGSTRYRLRCMVCFYGQHYVLLAYKPRVRQWVQYDDTSVKAVGDWTEVEKRCKAGIPVCLPLLPRYAALRFTTPCVPTAVHDAWLICTAVSSCASEALVHTDMLLSRPNVVFFERY